MDAGAQSLLAGGALLVATAGIGVGAARFAQVRIDDLFERWWSYLGLGFVVVTWLGVVFAEVGAFTRLAFPGTCALLAVALLGAAPRTRVRPRADRRPLVTAIAAALFITVAAATFFFPAFDVRVEARDPGTYALTGDSLARRGTLNFTDPSVMMLPRNTRDYLFPDYGPTRSFDSSRFLGFYLADLEQGLVEPQAQPAYVVWAAIGQWLAGMSGVLATAGVLLWLAAIGLAVLGRAMFGPVGVLAGMGLVAGVVPGWFARYSSAESIAVLLVTLGTLALFRFRSEGQRFHAVLAALAFGLCPLAKTELVVLYGPLALLAVRDFATAQLERKAVAWLWLPLTLLLGHTGAHAVLFAWSYHYDLLTQFELLPAEFLQLAAAGAVGLLVAAGCGRVAVRWWGALADARRRTVGALVRWALAVAVPAFMAWAYVGRPRQYIAGGSDAWNVANAPELGLAVSPWLLVLASVGGLLVVLRRRPALQSALFPLLLVAALLIVESSIIPAMMWAYRRMLPIVLPLLYLLAAGALAYLARAIGRRAGPVSAAAATVLLAAPAAWYHATAAPHLRSHEELPGATAVVQELAEVIHEHDIVIFEPRSSRGLVRFEAVAGVHLGRTVFRLHGTDGREETVRSLGHLAARRGGRLLLATSGQLGGPVWAAAVPVHQMLWRTHKLEAFTTAPGNWDRIIAANPGIQAWELPLRLPRVVEDQIYIVRFYELDVSRRMAPLPERAVAGELRGELDVGLWDDLHVDGAYLHMPESDPVNNYRWTSDRGVFLLPGMPADARDVVVRAGHNPLLEDQVVEAWLDGRSLGTRTIVEGWQDLRFPVPPRWRPRPGGTARLEIRVPAVVPANVGLTYDDDRPVGVRVDRVFWTRALPGTER